MFERQHVFLASDRGEKNTLSLEQNEVFLASDDGTRPTRPTRQVARRPC